MEQPLTENLQLTLTVPLTVTRISSFIFHDSTEVYTMLIAMSIGYGTITHLQFPTTVDSKTNRKTSHWSYV